MDFLDVSGISVVEEGNTVLKDISFSLPQHCNMAIAGETGSGKSTLLQTIAGLVQPKYGRVLFEGELVLGPQDVLVPGHEGIAYLSQQYELPQFLRVEQVLRYANTLTDKKAAEIYEICRISHLLSRRTNQLSGGEKQRIALARLLTAAPTLLLLDEPYSNLDTVHKNTLKAVIQDLSESLEITCILISHDPADTLSWADEILVMKAGELIQKGTPAQVYRKPVNEYAAGLFGKYNLLPANLAKLFPELSNPAKAQLLVRPENVKLSGENSSGPMATVKQIRYFGSFFETELILGDITLTARTLDNAFHPGDKVYLSVQPECVSAI